MQISSKHISTFQNSSLGRSNLCFILETNDFRSYFRSVLASQHMQYPYNGARFLLNAMSEFGGVAWTSLVKEGPEMLKLPEIDLGLVDQCLSCLDPSASHVVMYLARGKQNVTFNGR